MSDSSSQPSAPTEEIAGLVERVTFFSPESGFAVLRVKVRGQRKLVTVLGSVPTVSAGEWLTAKGWWVRDKEHGLQFKAQVLKAVPPTTSEGVERYLAGGFVKGVGIAMAEAKKAKTAMDTQLRSRQEQIAELERVVAERDQRLTEARAAQAELKRKERKLEEARAELELSVETRVNESIASLRANALKEAEGKLKLKITEKDETIASLHRRDLPPRASYAGVDKINVVAGLVCGVGLLIRSNSNMQSGKIPAGCIDLCLIKVLCVDTDTNGSRSRDRYSVRVRGCIDHRRLYELHPADLSRRRSPLDSGGVKLRTRTCILGLAGRFAAKNHVFADPRCCDALIGDLCARQMLARKRGHFLERVWWNARTKNGQVGCEPYVRQMICCWRKGRQWRMLRVQYSPHPDAIDTYIVLHVHAVGAVVRAGDIAKFGLIEGGDIPPQTGLHFSTDCLDSRGRSVTPP